MVSLRCITGARNLRRRDSGASVSNSATSWARSVRCSGRTNASVPSGNLTSSINLVSVLGDDRTPHSVRQPVWAGSEAASGRAAMIRVLMIAKRQAAQKKA